MDLGITGRTALITGGSRGIGAATADVLAAAGTNLILIGRTPQTLFDKAESIRASSGVDVRTHVCDVSNYAQIEALAERYREVDIVINNAGDMPSGDIFKIGEKAWKAGWDTKVSATVGMCRAFYPILRERGGGVIVNVSGIGAVLHRWDYVCSGMGNQAVEFLTQTLGARSPVDNIRVVCVSPGAVATERQEKVMADWFGEGSQPDWPFGRRASPREIAETVAFLASDRSSYTSGSIVVIDGGASISRVV